MVFMVGFVHSVAYSPDITVSYILYATWVILFYFFALSLFSMVIVYIQDLHMTLTSVNAENFKLLNGMHEGLLILNKNEDSR